MTVIVGSFGEGVYGAGPYWVRPGDPGYDGPDGYAFSPPTRPERIDCKGLFRYYTLDEGYTLVKRDGYYHPYINPTDDDLVDADAVYLGGHITIVSPQEASELVNAGYGSCLFPVPVVRDNDSPDLGEQF